MYQFCQVCARAYDDSSCSVLCPHRGIGHCAVCDCTICICDPKSSLDWERSTNSQSEDYGRKLREMKEEIESKEGKEWERE